MENLEIVIASAVRTPIGSFGGALKDVPAVDLGVLVAKEVIKRSNINPSQISEVIMGNVLQAGLGQNVARQIAVKAGIPVETPAFTVNKVCGSGMKAIILAVQSILSGDNEIVLAGGAENMSQAPYIDTTARWGKRMGDSKVIDLMIKDGLWDSFNDYHMGMTAENIAEKYGITREQQDAFALESQRKTDEAIKTGKFKDEIVPVEIKTRKGITIVDTDEHPRADASMENLQKLNPAFKKEGTVTAGNASGINDGAAAMLVMTRATAQRLGIKPMATIVAHAAAGVDPAVMGLGPIASSRKALDKAKLSINDIDLVEANEAFAAQAFAVVKELKMDSAKVNVNGGAIALGHPIGASGARIVVSLLHEMNRRNAQHGLATLCIGGGQGTTIIVRS